MTYSEFSEFIVDNCIEPLMSYDGFEVYFIDNKYYYYECIEEASSDEFFEIRPIAILTYDSIHDIQIKDGEILHTLFDCICCGEAVFDNCIKYIWFEKI